MKFKQIFSLLIVSLFLSSVFANELYQESGELTLIYRNRLAETIIDEKQNRAIVEVPSSSIEIDKFRAVKGDDVNLVITSNDRISSFCFDFPTTTNMIKINKIEIKNFLSPPTN
jgi:hypothetical protein